MRERKCKLYKEFKCEIILLEEIYNNNILFITQLLKCILEHIYL